MVNPKHLSVKHASFLNLADTRCMSRGRINKMGIPRNIQLLNLWNPCRQNRSLNMNALNIKLKTGSCCYLNVVIFGDEFPQHEISREKDAVVPE